jgi:hypothetical protein
MQTAEEKDGRTNSPIFHLKKAILWQIMLPATVNALKSLRKVSNIFDHILNKSENS